MTGHANEAEALAEIGRLITSSTDFGEVFEATAERISTLIPAETISLGTVDAESDTYTTLFRWGLQLPAGSIEMARALAGTSAEIAIRRGSPQIITDELRGKQTATWKGEGQYPLENMKSWLVAPLIVGGKAIGVIHFRASEAGVYTDQHRQLAERIANQIAGPIALAQLHHDLRESEKEQSALAQLAVELALAESAQEMSESIDRTLEGFFQFDRISIVTVDEDEHNLVQIYQRGLHVPGVEIGTVLKFTDIESEFYPWANELAGTTENLDDTNLVDRSSTHKDLGLESRMRAPFLTTTGYVGAIALNAIQPRLYSKPDQDFLKRVASQAAPALEKSFLLEKAEEDARIQQSVARIGRIVSEDLDLDRVYDRMADELEKLLQFDRLTVSLFDPETQVMSSEYFRGIAIPNVMPGDDISDPGKTVDWDFSGDSLRTAYGVQTDKEDELSSSLKELGLVSWIQSPFGVQATGPIGFLSLRSKIPNQYGEKEHELLRQVAMQVTPAIQNAKLYQQSTALSQQKERSSALDEENRELQRVADARSQFLSTVSHELRTPLTAISAFSDILAHNRPGNLEERQLSQINAIRRSTTSLSNLVDDLLDVSRADSGKLSLDTAPFDFQELISDFAPLAEGVASQKNQIVNIVNFEEPILLNGDRSRFNQVLNNLISNASKYSPENSEITVTMSHLSGHIEVEIADQGIGIAPHNLGSVFVPFFRAEDQETQKQSGTGLGLSVVKTLIQLHGGRVNIESTPGVGTKVKFWVPGVID